jgi:ABC-2 type transport system permease protein
VSPTLATASIVAGVCAAIGVSALGVGLGAAFPRFDATNPAEVPMSPGGLLYMTSSLLYAAGLTVGPRLPGVARPVDPTSAVWASTEGRLVLAVAAGLTLLVAAGALTLGMARLHRLEAGGE